ncbi:hypothetical protein LSAT2_011827 [Lamellibrachia satsuma]|nr:hypothetical protein LSAT2_011827 [Lamellibrachia satsuma]
MKKTQFLKRRFDAYNTRRRWSVHFPNSFRQVPRMSRPEEAELVLCQRLSLMSNMASIVTYGSSTELESFNGSEERNAGRERGGMKRRGA